MDRQEQSQLNLFLNELRKYDFVDGDLANSLLARYIEPLHKRRFFNPQLKFKYYASYWFKIAVQKGILENRGMGYKVHRGF